MLPGLFTPDQYRPPRSDPDSEPSNPVMTKQHGAGGTLNAAEFFGNL